MSSTLAAPFPGTPPPSNSEVTSGDQLAAGVAFNVLRALLDSKLLVINNEKIIPTTIKLAPGSVVAIQS